MEARAIAAPRWNVAPEKLGYFRWGRVAGKFLVTNDAGEWHLLDDSSFRRLLSGDLSPEHADYVALRNKGFLRRDLDLELLAEKVRRKKRFLGLGPHLHIVITTLRCNQSCKYCHASRTDMDRVDTDMSLETAKSVVDLAMQTTSPYVNFEFQGGEPTVNFDAIQFVVEYAREKNRYEHKQLDFSLVTNLTTMTEERAHWLLDHGVLLCTSLDGPKEVHDYNRPWAGNAAYEDVIRWIHWINAEYVRRGKDPELWHVDALMTTTKKSLSQWKGIVDLYVSLGIRNVHLRPLNPFGFATSTWKAIGYTVDEYMAFYEKALDYIIELNLQGTQVIEGTAATFLAKMLTPDDPNFVDLRSPVGSGSGQIAYNYDGRILPSDEGRMVDAMGDPFFEMGRVGELRYDELVGHPTAKALAVSSLLDTLPRCADCWNAPFCGVRPEHNYMQARDLFGQRPNTPKCKEHMSISRMLFDRLANDSTGRIETLFRRWTIQRPRDAS